MKGILGKEKTVKVINSKTELVNILSDMCDYNKSDTRRFLNKYIELLEHCAHEEIIISVSGLPKLKFSEKRVANNMRELGEGKKSHFKTLVPRFEVPMNIKRSTVNGFKSRLD